VRVGQHDPRLVAADRTLGDRDAVLIELGMDPLAPHRALIDQRLVQPHPLAPLQHRLGRDPALRQLPGREQIPQQSGIGPVGLGPMLASPGRLRVGRLGHMRLEPGGGYLLDHIPPTRATFHRQRHLAVGSTSDVVA
jgi:hypothetical protein